jgi:hypothetical protein
MHLVASYNEVSETDKSGFDKLLLAKCFCGDNGLYHTTCVFMDANGFSSLLI